VPTVTSVPGQASTVSFTSIPPYTISLGTALARVPRLQLLTDQQHPVPSATVTVTVEKVAANSLVSL
jgi:hypothetical protein